jgi:CheY-like chemotaxis protein
MLKILFVTLDADLRAVVPRALAPVGWQVTTVAHAGHAVLAGLTLPDFDVLIDEEPTADSGAAALAERLRRYCPRLQVVRICEAGAGNAGEGTAVVRPFTADSLIGAVLLAASAIRAA